MVQKVRVLVVDDSSFFRRRIRQELDHADEIEVVGEAVNGREAVALARELRPDLITMDVAMPLMDGIAAVREIMRTQPTNIIMISALTSEGARATLDALEAGAVDFLAKPGAVAGGQPTLAIEGLRERVIDIVRHRVPRRVPGPPGPVAGPGRAAGGARDLPRLVLIGASTGGPVALQRVLTPLPATCPFPVLVGVHMPAEFTATFAERLDAVCRVEVRLAADGDALQPGRVLVAPGGRQTLVEGRRGRLAVRVRDGGEHLYKPSIDLMFGSAAEEPGADTLGVILTGMGADGTEGARRLKQHRARIWSQDQATSVVYGMPYSVAKAGLSDRVMALDEIGPALGNLA